MRNWKSKFLLLSVLLTMQSIFGQLTGIKSIPADYASIEAAIADLNLQGVGPGGVTFNVVAGNSEFFSTPASGLITTLTGSATSPIMFQKYGDGTNPLIMAATPGTTIDRDFVICIAGGDYITFDGIDIQENSSNTDATMQMEWGYALVKANSSAPFDGCEHVVIKNCNISLNKANPNSVGIYSGCHTSSSLAALTLTAATDAMNYCKFFSNSITNINSGISLNGFSAPEPYLFYDDYNEIGSDGGNSIFDFGSNTSAKAYAINVSNQNAIIIANHDIHGTAASGTGVYGISSKSISSSIYNNTITLDISGGTYFDGSFYGIACWTNENASIYNNNVTDCNFLTATNGFNGIYYSGNAADLDCYSNNITNNHYGATSDWGWGNFTGIAASQNYLYQPAGSTWNIHNNIISGNQRISSLPYGDNKYIACFATSGMGEIFTVHVDHNIIENNTAVVGQGSQGIMVYCGNKTLVTINHNKITNISSTSVTGIYQQAGISAEVMGNELNNLSAVGTFGGVLGITVSGAPDIKVGNNFISNFSAPASTFLEAVIGLNVYGFKNVGVYYNTIYLNATSSSATTFGSTGLGLALNASTTCILRNNIVVNTSTPVFTGGNAYTVAFRVNGDLTSYDGSSDNNDFYAGTPGLHNLIFYNGTNADQTLPAFKTRVFPRDRYSVTENPPFIDAVNGNLHINSGIPTQCESGGKPVLSPAITTDFDNDPRGSFPDIGADEFAGTILDLLPPVVVYTPLLNTISLAARTLITTIKDPSGVPVSGSGLPVLYLKINSGAYSGVQGIPAAGDQFSFTFGAGVVPGDIVSYYIAAQDGATSSNAGSYPLGGIGFTTDPPACSTPPSSPNTYLVTTALSGPVTVGSGGTYPSLTGAGGLFQAINNSIITGNLTAIIVSNLTEAGTYPLNQWTDEPGGSNFSLTVQPDGSAERLVSGNMAQGMIRLNGADHVTFDGRNGGTGLYLRFRNINTSGQTFVFLNDATGNTIRNCYIEGCSGQNAGGVVVFSTTTGSSGNDSNTITGCILRERTDQQIYPYTLILSTGTQWKENSSNTISNNKIMNFYRSGIDIFQTGNGENWNISGNSVFNMLSTTSTGELYGIRFAPSNNSANGSIIADNYVGGQAAQCSGPAWTNSSALVYFSGINVNTSQNSSYLYPQTANITVRNNTVQNINLSNTGNLNFYGILVFTNNNYNSGIILVTGNTVGHNSIPGSITVGGYGFLKGIAAGGNTLHFQDNLVANLSFTNSDPSNGSFINAVEASSSSALVKDNEIHDILSSNIYGLIGLAAGDNNSNVEYNTIYNLTATNLTSSFASVRGLSTNGSGTKISKNQIFNLVNLSTASGSGITGIGDYGWGTFSNNIISLGENSGNLVTITGIYITNNGDHTFNFNNVSITGSSGSETVRSYCFNNEGWIYTNAFLRDNIFVNSRTGPGKNYTVASTNTDGSFTSNYNDLYSISGPFALWGTTEYADLTAWQTASGQDANSISTDPAFTSVNNLLPTNLAIGKLGSYLSGVPGDITGALRSDPPDLGAYEFTEIPIVTTIGTTGLTNSSATLHGTVNANDLTVNTWFDYGLTSAYGFSVAGAPAVVTGFASTDISAGATSLLPGTKYHFRARGATTEGLIAYGEDKTFTTSVCLPSYISGCSQGDGLTNLQLNTINQAIPCSGTPEWYHDYTSSSTELLVDSPNTLTLQAGHSDTHVTVWLDVDDNNIFDPSELVLADVICSNAGADYTAGINLPYGTPPGPHCLRFMTNRSDPATNPCGDYNFGNSADFTVVVLMPSPPTVMTNAATGVTSNYATFNGSVNANRALTTVTFQYGQSTSYGYTVAGIPGTVSGNSVTMESTPVSGLYAGITYHYRIVGSNSMGTSYGNDMTFTTPTGPPLAVTLPVTQLQPNSARLNGNASANGASTTVTFEYGTSTDYGTTVSASPSTITGNYIYSTYVNISSLIPNTTYHYRINASNSSGMVHGDDMTFVTPLTCLPDYVYGCQYQDGLVLFQLNTINQSIACDNYYHDFTSVSSDLVTGIPYTLTVQSAWLQTHVAVWIDFNDDNLFELSERVVADLLCVTSYTNYTATIIISSGATAGSHKMRFRTNLNAEVTDPCNTYSYGNGADFSINIVAGTDLPTVVTTAASNISYYNATLNGTVNANGTVTTVIFEYGLTSSYGFTVAGIPGTITGNTVTPASAVVSGLLDNSTYHCRIVGYHSAGGATGNDMTFTTPAAPCSPSYSTGCNTYGVGLNYFHLNTIDKSILCDGSPYTWYHDYSALLSTDLNIGSSYNLTVRAGYSNTYARVWIDYNDNEVFESLELVVSNFKCTLANTDYTVAFTIPCGKPAGEHLLFIRSNYGSDSFQACGNLSYGNAAIFSINAISPVSTPTVSGPTLLCEGTSDHVYTTESGYFNYLWSISSNGTVTGGGTSTDDYINVTWNSAGSGTVSVNYSNANGCSAALPGVLNVTVNPFPDPAGSITGQAEVCAQSVGLVYSVPAIGNATSYSWTVPSEFTITSGTTTNSITVDVDAAAFAGDITVQGINDCGPGLVAAPFHVTSVFLPPQHGPISGNKEVCAGASGEVYSIAPVPYADSYVWAVPSGATIVSGGTTNTITVNFSSTKGVISVYATNVCGNSSTVPALNVKVWPIPTPPVITYDSKKIKLTSNQGQGNQWCLNGAAIAGATGKNYTPVQSGTYTAVVILHGCSSAPSNSIIVNIPPKSAPVIPTDEDNKVTEFIVYPNPNQGYMNYKITLPEEEILTIEVYNSIGDRIYKQNNIKVDRLLEGNINLKPLNDGVYIVCLRGVRTFLTRRIIIRN